MSLLTLQRDLRAWLITGSDTAAAKFGATARAGLGVYQNNYRAQLVACLGETFERVKSWLGDDEFLAAAARHIDASPPCNWTLDRYGSNFPDTLRARYPQHPEVAELAWLDRALADAFVGPDVEPVSASTLAAIEWERAVLQLTPTLQLEYVTTSSPAIWTALSAGETPPQVEQLPAHAAVIVWRQGLTSCFRVLDAEEHRALQHARSGATFGSLCALLVAATGETNGVTTAGELLARWLRDGLIIAVA